MRVTVESHYADVAGCLGWLADNDLSGPVYEVELVNEGEALVHGYVRDPTQQPDTVLVCATGSEPFLLTYRRRMPVHTLPPAAALVP